MDIAVILVRWCCYEAGIISEHVLALIEPSERNEVDSTYPQDPGLPVSRYDTEIAVFGPIRPQETGSKSSPLWDRTSNFVPIRTHWV